MDDSPSWLASPHCWMGGLLSLVAWSGVAWVLLS